MKRIITILAIFMTMICGSVFFVSCSNSYKKMQLVVEYALPTEDNKDVEWVRVDKGTNFDYILSSGVYSEADMAHVLYLRISVKGTSKKVSSLHISRSESTSVTLESQTVKPGEAFKVLVHNIGSVRFTATPSHGGEDKAVTFGVNVYKELTGISQRSTCVPAVVVGGNIFLDNLTKLVKYEPMGETNQTGVNFALAGVGTLANDGTDNLLGRDFVADENYTLLEDGIKHINRGEDDECDVNLTHNNGLLSLNVSTKYVLTPHNNVIHLVATSKYHEDITTDIYVYIVENFKDALLISYDKNVELDNEGKIPTNPDDAKPIDNEIIIYNSIVDSNLVGQKFNAMDMYVYTNKSIYSFASKPGMKLNVFVNGTKYNYEDVVNDDFGIQISSIYDLEDDLLGLKFAVNPNSESKLKTYNIRIEVDFIAFDFSASDTAPVLNLTKEFKINVETLASGFNVNGRGYLDNSAEAIKGNYATITEMNKDNTSSNKVAELYTTYSLEKIGLPLNIQPTPPNAINSKVYVGFYNKCYEDNNGKLALGTNLFTDGKLQLLNSINDAVSNTDGLFEIDFSNKNRRVYLRFNDGVVIDDIKEVFMVCKVACTPEKFGLDSEIDKKYITFVARIDVVGAVDQIYIQKTDNDGNEHTLTDKYLPTNTIKTAYINFKSISNAVDYSQITISSGKGHIQFSHNGIDWDNKITADKLGNAKIKTLYFKVNQPCVDSLEIESPNGKSAKLEYEFVNVVNNISTIKVDYDSPYIENIGKDNLTSEQVVKYDGKTTSLEYLALQSGRLVQFKVSGDGKNSTIASIDAYTLLPSDEEYMGITKDDKPLYQTAISKFSASAVRIPTIGQYFFDVNANSVGFTSIVFVTVQYYAEVDRKVELQTKYFVYEVAVYNPAKNLTVIADKESIIYINDNYSEVSDVSIVNFDILVNSATRSILFSNAELNQKINGSYGFEGTSCIYGFVVSPSPSVFPSGTDGQEYFKLDSDNLAEKVKDTECYVNNATRRFWVKAVKDLKPLQDKGISYIYFDVAIYQFGKKVETSEVRQVVYLGNYNKADDVAIVSGVDTYYNTYLSLLNGDDSVEIEAYATNENDDVTYLELGREIYRQGETNEYNGPNLTVEYDNVNNIFTINATGEGGVYNIIFFTKDSEKSENRIEKSITVTVSDGASEETAYFITSAQEFAKLKGKTPSGEDVTKGKYYRLRHDVNISALGEYGWWEESRNFAGHLSGSMTITDPNSGEVVYKSYALTELTISRQFQIGTDICYGLFNTVSGTIKDVVFRDVVINVELGETASTSIINIGAITAINSGNINNCSVNIKSSAIQFGKTTEIVESNIGLIAGLNAGSIIHTTSNIGSNYSHLADVEDGGKLLVTIPIANKLDGNSVNIGAVVGQNTGLIQSDYSDDSSKSINSIISVVANIKVVVEYDNQNAPNQIDLNVGGVAGYNNTKDIEKGIKNIAITGSIIVGDKANIGAIVGKNAGTISEVANYGAHIEGVVYKDNYATTVGDTPETLTYHSYNNEENVINQEQNIGGIIGFNDSVAVDNVRVLFIHFESDKIKIAPNSAVISGVGNVGGIIGKSKHTTLTRAYVENFVENTGATINYNIIGKTVKVNNVDVGANVAGLIASSEDENNVLLSFVQADFDVTGCDFYEFGKGLTSYQYAYFKGDIKVEESKISEEQNAQNAINNTTYIIKNIVKADGSKIVKEFGLDDIVGDSNEEYVNGIYISDEYTANGNGYQFTIVWARDTKYEINEEKPYLMYRLNGQELLHTLTIRPTEVVVNVHKDYFGEDLELIEDTYAMVEDGIYLQYVDNNNTPGTTDDDKTVATAIVYYNKNGNNTHRLVTEGANKGLIEKAILPNISGVDGSYSVGITYGSSIAMLTDSDSTITFTGVGRVELKFVSLFDSKKSDTVVIFVENPINKDNVFSANASAGLEDINSNGEKFGMRVNTSALMSLSLNKVNNQEFDNNKTYIKFNATSIKYPVGNTEEEYAGSEQLIKIKSLSPALDGYTDRFGLGQLQIESVNEIKDWSKFIVTIEVKLYLNISKLYTDNNLTISLDDKMTEDVELATKLITIEVYNNATNLTVSGDTKAKSGENINIEAELTTGYLGSVDNCYIEVSRDDVGGNLGNRLQPNMAGQDIVDFTLTAVNKNAQDLFENEKAESLKRGDDKFTIWDLFTIFDSNGVYFEKLSDSTGYKYVLNLELKDEYKDLIISNSADKEWLFNLNVSDSRNSQLNEDVKISFVPQDLINFRLENYSSLVAREGVEQGTTEAEFVSSQTESSLIIPSESGLVKIYAEYAYSYFENIKITSSREVIDGKEYFIRYQQMVYNKDRDVYESYAGITADGETLGLTKVSYSDGSYDGVIFVRTILDNIVGVRKTFTITVSADTYDIDGNIINISREKVVISQYRPGVYISVDNALTEIKDDNLVYLVENGKDNAATIVAKVYGYEFNVQPIVTTTAISGADKDDVKNNVYAIQDGLAVKDATGAYIIKYKLSVFTKSPFKLSITMQLIDNGNEVTESSNDLFFYPVDYIIDNVYLASEANGQLYIPVKSGRNIDLVWETKLGTIKSTQINEAIYTTFNDAEKFLNLFYIENTSVNGQEKKYLSEYFDNINTNFTIKKSNDVYRIQAFLPDDPMMVYFNLWYGYDLTNKKVVFSATKTDVCTKPISHSFKLVLAMSTTEDTPEPISTVEGLKAMLPGENYMLTTDLVLKNWIPLTTAIASLDGNGKTITIESFDISVVQGQDINMGLFATVDAGTILKNIVIDVSMLQSIDNKLYIKNEFVTGVNINFGLLAGVNNGLIYNCEVISKLKSRNIEIVIGDTYKMTFGALVAVNNKNITNSRVGTEYFEQIYYGNGSPYYVIVPCGDIYFTSRGIMAGFVGVNASNGIISSCFVANTSIENTSDVADMTNNRTAGFVATNNGLISYSYVKGLEKNILTTKTTTDNKQGKRCVIYASGAGSVAGFVFYNANNGVIHDCYSNTVCISNSAAAAGFVYDGLNGEIKQCYSATKVYGNEKLSLATELPFVGAGIEKDNAKQLLSNSKMLNCYYLDDGTEYGQNYTIVNGAVEPKALSLESFANQNNLNNFSFVNSTSLEQQLNGVWTYSTAVDKNRSTYALGVTGLPELTSANTIARSAREYKINNNSATEVAEIEEVDGYELGTKKNPYIIRNIEEYQSVFITRDDSSAVRAFNGYVRFINDIDFKVGDALIEVITRSNYILGDKNEKAFTVIDGNGMKISNVKINYSTNETGNLGLFSEVYNSVIKGLKISYTGEDSGSSTAGYVGGVAGVAENSYLIDLTLDGSIVLRAKNVIGGAVGKITGLNSGLYNISSTLSVSAGSGVGNLYSASETALSYAGGIAGIVDIGSENTIFNISRLTTNGVGVVAERAGGIAGYLGKNVNATRLTYVIASGGKLNNSNIIPGQILGISVAGGLVADNFADIELSQATGATAEGQYELDKEFAQYLRSKNLLPIDNADGKYGNLNVVTGKNIVGGFIGVNYGGEISNSLTKANIGYSASYGLGSTVGGFIGESYGGSLNYVYAQNYIQLLYKNEKIDTDSKIVGGIVGNLVYDVSKYSESGIFAMANVVGANFFDKDQLEQLAIKYATNTIDKPVIEYVIGKNLQGVELRGDLQYQSNPVVNYGVYNADDNNAGEYLDGKIVNTNVDSAEYYDMEALYYVYDGNSEIQSSQQKIFNKLFIVWPEDFWYKDYTKFMPVLKLDNATDYIKLQGEDDLKLMEQFPDRNFILVQDISITKNANYVVNENFTGTLISTKNPESPNGDFYKFTIALDANTVNDNGAGFFKETTNARIANVIFEYKALNLNGTSREYARVGGVSSKDEDSRFEQISVRQSGDNSAITGNAIVLNFGSIVGEATCSKIISCDSNLNYSLNTSNANIGGLVGYLNGHNNSETEGVNPIDGLITSSVYTGNITAIGAGATVGGIVGKSEYTNISDSRALISNENDNITSPLKINLEITQNTYYIGGIAGYVVNSSIDNCKSNIEVNKYVAPDNPAGVPSGDTEANPDAESTYYVGGTVGCLEIDKDIAEETILDCYSKLTSNIDDVDNLYIGGIVAKDFSTNAKLKNVVAELIINPTRDVESPSNSPIDNLSQYVCVGGIVASVDSLKVADDHQINISNAVAMMECDIDYAVALYGGGIIGQAQSRYAIDNSSAIGYIWANNAVTTHIGSEPTLTVLGGLVGIVGTASPETEFENEIIDNQEIKNSYTVLTLDTSNVYQGANDKTHEVYTNGVVGYASSENTITATNVLYSSDYTLTLDEVAKYNNAPINVSAGVLLYANNALSEDLKLEGGWLYQDKHLPIPSNTTNILANVEILKFDGVDEYGKPKVVFSADETGKPYSPVIVNGSEERYEDLGQYQYYLLVGDFDAGLSVGALNGVILGNGKTITTDSGLITTINMHSAISNVSVRLTKGISTGVIAGTNNGTIFMADVDYIDIVDDNISSNIAVGDGFAGIANTNNGLISYCFNVGNATANSENVSGLVAVNNANASIEDCYFTGSFLNNTSGNIGAGLVHTNSGYIANTYAAGMAGCVIKDSKEGSRYNNVYYDYYAIYTTETEYDNLVGVFGVSTSELQSDESYFVKSDESYFVNSDVENRFSNWEIIGMHNIANGNSYNYGYPVHNYKQYEYINVAAEEIDSISKTKYTGNGTFNKIINPEGYAITSINTANEDVKAIGGKLVVRFNKDNTDTVEACYNYNPYLINNIGVLYQINKLSSTNNIYFELELNIVLPNDGKSYQDNDNLITSWPGIGTDSKPFTGVFTSRSSDIKQDVDLGINYYEFDTTLFNEVEEDGEYKSIKTNFNVQSGIIKNDSPKTITNLTGGALFNCVSDDALITKVGLKNSTTKNATLINEVTGDVTDNDDEIVTVYDVTITGTVKTASNSGMAGMVYTVSAGATLHIHTITSDNYNFTIDNSNGESQVAGVIYTNEGTVNVKNSSGTLNINVINNKESNIAGFVNTNTGTINLISAINIDLSASIMSGGSKQIESVSGFATSNYGIIVTSDSDNSTVTIGAITSGNSGTSKYIAGLIGNMYDGYVAGFDVEFASNTADAYKTKGQFGGVVAEFTAGELGAKYEEDEDNRNDIQKLISEDKSIIVTLPRHVTASVYGGIVASSIDGDEKKIVNVEIASGTSTVNSVALEDKKYGYGLVIGRYTSKIDGIYYKSSVRDFTVKGKSAINVGAIIGYASVNEFNFTNVVGDVDSTVVIVKGYQNVGGFIGHYNATGEDGYIKMNSEDESNYWPINSTSSYAIIRHSEVESDNQSDVITYKNFGGLIGFWNSIANFQCTAGTELIDITNNNVVLDEVGDIGDLNGKKTIQNVGGIVGQINGAKTIVNVTNEGQVGLEIDTNEVSGSHSPIQGVGEDSLLKTMKNISNVGGIVGYVEGDEDGLIELYNVANNAAVYGMYCVGGVIGCSEVKVEIEDAPSYTIGTGNATPAVATIEDAGEGVTEYIKMDMSQGSVVGLVDVGGIIGKTANLSFIGRDDYDDYKRTTIKLGKVIGVVNVGGIVGRADESITIKNLDIIAIDGVSIMGNLNVGAISAYAINAQLDTVSISKTTICGTIFSFEEFKNDEFIRNHYNLPTNIGGLFGYLSVQTIDTATNTSSSSFKNVTSDVSIITDNEFEVPKDKNVAVVAEDGETSKNYLNVNMTSNDVGRATNDDKNKLDSSRIIGYYPDKRIRYNAVNGGIGAFAGSLITKKSDKDSSYALPDYNSTTINGGVSIYAPYGINVGGVYGYTNCPPDLLNFPSVTTDSEPLYVAGALFVGGYIGRSEGFSDTTATFEATTLKVAVQRYKDESGNIKTMAGGYGIGGVIGYVSGNVYGINLTNSEGESPIKVYNGGEGGRSPMYVGALIGGMSGHTLKNCSISENLCSDVNGIIQSPDTFNYGGLVGLVEPPNLPNENNKNEITVLGTHYYPFTVDIIQSPYFDNGTSEYNYNPDTKVFAANAHYINTGNIQVSPSADTSLYDGTDDNNPTKTNAKGWAKEYTMFRSLACVFEQKDADTGNSIQVVYSANYITEVKTKDIKDTEGKVNGKEIVYTIYQPLNQQARLYCKWGIAVEKAELPTIQLTKNGGKYFETNYPVEDLSSDSKDTFWTHIGHPRQLGILDDNVAYNGDGTFKLIIPEEPNGVIDNLDDLIDKVNKNAEDYRRTFGYTYYVVEGYLNSGTNVNFAFDTVFGAYNTGYDDNSLYSPSGSLFEVTGTATIPLPLNDADSELELSWWQWIILGVGAGLMVGGGIAAAIGTGGAALPAILIGGGALILGGGAIASAMMGGISTATGASEEIFATITDKSMGYLSSSYARQISWEKGELSTYYDAYLVVETEVTLISTDNLKDLDDADLTNYDKFCASQLGIDTSNKTARLPITYFNCTTSRNVPSDINSEIKIGVSNLTDGSSNILKAIGVDSIKIPKYQWVENELYCYMGDEGSVKIMATNYERISNGVQTSGAVINIAGYGYVIDFSKYDSFETTLSDDVLKEYGVSKVYNTKTPYDDKAPDNEKGMTFNLSTTSSNVSIPVDDRDKNRIYWGIAGASQTVDNGKMIVSRNLEPTLTEPADGSAYIKYTIKNYETGKLTIEDVNGNNVDISITLDDYDSRIHKNIYFKLVTSGGIDIVLTPSFGSSTTGFSVSEMGYSNLYFVYDTFGTGMFKQVYADFILGKSSSADISTSTNSSGNKTEIIVENGIPYAITPIDATNSIGITLYKFDLTKTGNTEESFFASGDDDSIVVATVEKDDTGSYSYTFTKEDRETGLSGTREYYFSSDYSISETSYMPATNYYLIKDDKLYRKEQTTYGGDTHVSDTHVSETIYYSAIPKQVVEQHFSFNNRYLYQVDGFKFYTRFNYGSDFFKQNGNFRKVLYLVKNMEDDDIPYKTIDTLLLPNSSSSTVLKETLFAESARVSLSMPKGSSSKIYTKYLITRTGEQDNYTYELDDEEYNNGAYGRIICGGGNS